MSRRILLSVDPGVRTGISLCQYSATEPLSVIETWDVPGSTKGFHAWSKELVSVDEIVCEDFILLPGKYGIVLDSLKVIGALQYLALERQVPLTFQPPAGRIKAVPNEVLKVFGMYLPGKAHRNELESNRHALWYMKRRNHLPTLKVGWPRKEA